VSDVTAPASSSAGRFRFEPLGIVFIERWETDTENSAFGWSNAAGGKPLDRIIAYLSRDLKHVSDNSLTCSIKIARGAVKSANNNRLVSVKNKTGKRKKKIYTYIYIYIYTAFSARYAFFDIGIVGF